MAKKLDTIYLVADMEDDLRISVRGAKAIARQLDRYVGKTLVVTIEEYEEKRSGSQNRWYWGCAVPTIIAFRQDTEGEVLDKDEVHFYNLMHVAGRRPQIKEVFGMETIVMEGKTTSQMSVKDFMNFKEQLQKHFAELGCIIPDPSEQNFSSDFLNQEFKKEKRRLDDYNSEDVDQTPEPEREYNSKFPRR